MNEQLINRIRQCPNLPSLPTIAMQVLDLAQKADVDIAEIARIISRDPALSSKILRTVNSSFYARSQNVSTISHALVILGLQSVKTLVLGFSLVSNLTKSKGTGLQSPGLLEAQHSSPRRPPAPLPPSWGSCSRKRRFWRHCWRTSECWCSTRCLASLYTASLHARAASHDDLAAVEQQALGERPRGSRRHSRSAMEASSAAHHANRVSSRAGTSDRPNLAQAHASWSSLRAAVRMSLSMPCPRRRLPRVRSWHEATTR